MKRNLFFLLLLTFTASVTIAQLNGEAPRVKIANGELEGVNESGIKHSKVFHSLRRL